MVYQAVWAPTNDFGEVLISKKMLHDHSPYVVLDALNKVTFISVADFVNCSEAVLCHVFLHFV